MIVHRRPSANTAVCWAGIVAVAACCVALVAAPSISLQPGRSQDIRIGRNVRVNAASSVPLVEPHVSANPSDPAHLVGAAIVADPALAFGPNQRCAAFASRDGGQTWQWHDFDVTECADPWVAVTPRGHAVIAVLGKYVHARDRTRVALLVFHSGDGGATWPDRPAELGFGHDHPTLAADPSSSGRTVYVVSGKGLKQGGQQRWGVLVAASRDGGRSFGPPVVTLPSNLNLNAETPAVLSDGALMVSFTDFERNAPGTGKGVPLDQPRAWALRSDDGGRTFSVPLFVGEWCAARGWSSLTVDASRGSLRDATYFACRVQAAVIAVSSTRDHGETWGTPVRVQGAETAQVLRRDLPAVAVNAKGIVGLAWVDTRQGPTGVCHEVRFSASVNGGRAFLTDRKVSDADSCPGEAENGAAFRRWPRGGD